MLVEPEALASRLAAGGPVTVLDVRWQLGGPPGRPEFERSHVAGARFVDLETDLAGPPGEGGRHPLPAPANFGRSMRRLGVTSSVPVVVYDGRDSTSAARSWWLLAYFGHPDVSILDGGFAAWVEAGGPVEAGAPAPPAGGDFEPVAGGLAVLDAEGAARVAQCGLLLDARAGERYRGEVEPVDAVAGHIPGAVSAPTWDNLEASGRFRPVAELRARFTGLGAVAGDVAPSGVGGPGEAGEPGVGGPGVGGEPGVGAYCGSGITAAHEVFALRLAGVEAALYPGSWSEWIGGPSRPVAKGAAPG